MLEEALEVGGAGEDGLLAHVRHEQVEALLLAGRGRGRLTSRRTGTGRVTSSGGPPDGVVRVRVRGRARLGVRARARARGTVRAGVGVRVRCGAHCHPPLRSAILAYRPARA